MSLPAYQTIPELGIKGRMDTTQEYAKIGLPKDLTNQQVLDIGCNEGAYMLECLKRKASLVVGVDESLEWTTRARDVLADKNNSYGGIAQLHTTDAIEYLEKKSFEKDTFTYNLILCLSVSHLVKYPHTLVYGSMRLLAPGGLLIFEVNDRLQTIPLQIPESFKLYGKNKDNRSVYHYVKDNK